MTSGLYALHDLREHAIFNQTTARTDLSYLFEVLESQYYFLLDTKNFADVVHPQDIEIIIPQLRIRILDATINVANGNQIDFITCMYEVSRVAESLINWYNRQR